MQYWQPDSNDNHCQRKNRLLQPYIDLGSIAIITVNINSIKGEWLNTMNQEDIASAKKQPEESEFISEVIQDPSQ